MHLNSRIVCLSAAAVTALGAALVVGGPACYVPKPPEGCASCGSTGGITYCENGCKTGSPGLDGGAGPQLKWFYCYSLGSGQSAQWDCELDPPAGWSFTLCAPDASGNCCIYQSDPPPYSSQHVLGYDGCTQGDPCGGGGPF